MIKITQEIINYWLSFGMEGRPIFSKEESGISCKGDTLMLLDAYDDARPSTVWFKDINGEINKGYMGWNGGKKGELIQCLNGPI